MDPNQTQTPQPTPPIQSAQPPVVNQAPPQPTPQTTEGASHKGVLLFLIMLLILAIGAGATYIATSKKTEKPTPAPVKQANYQQPTISQPSPTATQTPEDELQQVNIENPDADIKDIQTDLQQL